jgi:hypothetical protein
VVWNRPGRPKAAAVASLVTHSLGDLGCVTSKVKSAAGSSLNVDGRVTICGSSTTTQPYAQVIKLSLECKLRYVAKVNGKARQVIFFVSLSHPISFELPHNKTVVFIQYISASIPKRV